MRGFKNGGKLSDILQFQSGNIQSLDTFKSIARKRKYLIADNSFVAFILSFSLFFVSHLIIDPSEINQGASANLDRKRDRKEVTNSCLRQLFTQINDYVCDTNPSFENQPQNVTIYYCVSKDLKTLNAIDKTNLVVSIEMKAVLRPINQGSLVSAFFILEKHALQMF